MFSVRRVATLAARRRGLSTAAANLGRMGAAGLAPEITEAHAAACAAGSSTYLDPVSGLTVFTAYAHAQRGVCCGSRCRHCCFEHANVRARRKPAAARTRTRASGGPRKSSVYTRSGDGGLARLVGESAAATPKFDPVFEAVGDVDELGVKIGAAAFELDEGDGVVRDRLHRTQALLLDAGAALTVMDGQRGSYAENARDAFDGDEIAALERDVDALDAALPPLRNFVVATGPRSCLALHDARVVCRRAERRVWARVAEIEKLGETYGAAAARVASVAKFLNRLSDFLFVAARAAAERDVVYDVSANVRRKRERRRDEDAAVGPRGGPAKI
jgi:ATP:cob(I)alamin adenosyltransferase